MCHGMLLVFPPNGDIISKVSHQVEMAFYLIQNPIDSALFITTEAKLSFKSFQNHHLMICLCVAPSEHLRRG